MLFSTYFDHSIQNQPKTAEDLIIYIGLPFSNMNNAFLAFFTKNNDNDAFSLNLLILTLISEIGKILQDHDT